MSRNRAYTREQREKVICRKRKKALDLFHQEYYYHRGRYSKGGIHIWRCQRDRSERLPDKREIIVMIKQVEEVRECIGNDGLLIY